MTKTELIDAVVEAASGQGVDLTKKDARVLLDVVFETVSGAIKEGERFSYPNFGTFRVKHRKARKGHNPKTREQIDIPASNSVGFKPATSLYDLVNE